MGCDNPGSYTGIAGQLQLALSPVLEYTLVSESLSSVGTGSASFEGSILMPPGGTLTAAGLNYYHMASSFTINDNPLGNTAKFVDPIIGFSNVITPQVSFDCLNAQMGGPLVFGSGVYNYIGGPTCSIMGPLVFSGNRDEVTIILGLNDVMISEMATLNGPEGRWNNVYWIMGGVMTCNTNCYGTIITRGFVGTIMNRYTRLVTRFLEWRNNIGPATPSMKAETLCISNDYDSELRRDPRSYIGLIDEVMLLSPRLSRYNATLLASGSSPLSVSEKVIYWHNSTSMFNGTTFRDPDYGSHNVTMNADSISLVNDSAITTNFLPSEWSLKCRSISNPKLDCDASCLVGQGGLTCSGDASYCSWTTRRSQVRQNWTVMVSDETPDQALTSISDIPTAPKLCMPRKKSQCECSLIKMEELRDTPPGFISTIVGNMIMDPTVLEEYLPRNLGQYYPELRLPNPDQPATTLLCRSGATLAELSSVSTEKEMLDLMERPCVDKTGRKLLSIISTTGQFVVTLGDTDVVVSQTYPKDCQACDAKAVYKLKLSVGPETQTEVIMGQHSLVPLSVKMLSESGTMDLLITNEANAVLFSSYESFVGRSTITLSQCTLCWESLTELPKLAAIKRMNVVILVMLVLLLILILGWTMFFLIRGYGRVMMNFLNQLGCCLCCVKMRERSDQAANSFYMNFSNHWDKAKQKTDENSDSEESRGLMEGSDTTTKEKERPQVKRIILLPKKKSSVQSKVTGLLAILCLMTLSSTFVQGAPAYVCTSGITLTTASNKCDGMTGNCTLSLGKETQGTIPPYGDSLCYTLKSKTKVIGILVIQKKAIKKTTPYKDMYCSIGWLPMFQSHQSCAGHGTCKSIGTSVTPDSDPDGMFSTDSPMLMTNPGKTTARGGCGCITCGNCFSCSASCIYSRYALVTNGQTPYYFFSKGETFRQYQMTIMLDGALGLSTLWDGLMVPGTSQTVSTNAGSIKITITGELAAEPQEDNPFEVIISAGASLDAMGIPVLIRDSFGTSMAIVSPIGIPTKDLLGDIQFPRNADITEYKWDEKLAILSPAAIYDNADFAKSSLLTLRNHPQVQQVQFSDLAMGSGDLFAPTLISLNKRSSYPLVIGLETPDGLDIFVNEGNVRPTIKSVGALIGKYASDRGCSFNMTVCSSLGGGMVDITTNIDGFDLITTAMSIPEPVHGVDGSGCDVAIIHGMCTMANPSTGEVTVSGSDGTDTASIVCAGLQSVATTTNTTNVLVVAAGDLGGGSIDGSWYSGLDENLGLLSKFSNWFQGLFGLSGPLGAIVGFLLSVVMVAGVVYLSYKLTMLAFSKMSVRTNNNSPKKEQKE